MNEENKIEDSVEGEYQGREPADVTSGIQIDDTAHEVVISEQSIPDEFYQDARKAVFETGRASTSLLQRKLGIGYARAARLIDMLEERGAIGKANGAEAREVFIKDINESDPIAVFGEPAPEPIPEEPVKIGRPTLYSQELADKICEELAQGISLRTVCIPDEMPCLSTVFSWFRKYPDFLQQYARAKEESADAMSEEILDISDDGRNDWMEIELKNGGSYMKVDQEAVQRSKLRVDTRKWIMSKMKPKKYGDKVDVTSDGKAIKGNAIIFTDFSNETDSQ